MFCFFIELFSFRFQNTVEICNLFIVDHGFFLRKCKNDSDLFCYICGEMTASKYRRKISDRVKKLYLAYFGCAVENQDKNWAPHVCCLDYSNRLNKWFAGGKPTLSFAVPMLWREHKDHVTDCYFCLADTQGLCHNARNKILYPSLPSAISSVAHSDQLVTSA